MSNTIWRCPRCGVERDHEFNWAHRPLGPPGNDIRTCGVDPEPVAVLDDHELVLDPRFPNGQLPPDKEQGSE